MKNNANRLKLMKIINQASFAMDDVKLFLDTHPSCSEAIEYYKKVKKIRMAITCDGFYIEESSDFL